MKETYFKGLEKILTNDCYINIYKSKEKYPVMEIKSINKFNEEELIYYAPTGTIMSALSAASNNFLDEKRDNNLEPEKKIKLDDVLVLGFIIQIFRLPNNQILSFIYEPSVRNIPVKTVLGDNIKNSIEILNDTLQSFDLILRKREFLNYAIDQTSIATNPKTKLLKNNT